MEPHLSSSKSYSSDNLLLPDYTFKQSFQSIPSLYSSKFSDECILEFIQFKLTSKSIRQVDFSKYYFGKRKYAALINSNIGLQYEILSIPVEDRIFIYDLIHKMPNLQTLIVEYEGKEWGKESLRRKSNYRHSYCCSTRSEESVILSLKAELVEWLKNHLPLTHAISRDIISNSNIRIWIVELNRSCLSVRPSQVGFFFIWTDFRALLHEVTFDVKRIKSTLDTYHQSRISSHT